MFEDVKESSSFYYLKKKKFTLGWGDDKIHKRKIWTNENGSFFSEIIWTNAGTEACTITGGMFSTDSYSTVRELTC